MMAFTRRVRVAQILLAVAALSAAVAAVGAAVDLRGADAAVRSVQAWRTCGLLTFAAIFAVLAVDPARHAALFVIALANKVALAVFGVVLWGATDAASLVYVDGALAVVLATAFVLSRPNRPATTASPPRARVGA